MLASASPRRRDLLAWAGVPVHDVRPTSVEETPLDGEGPAALVRRLAVAKAEAAPRGPHEVVLGSDTVVALGSTVLGKPRDDEEAAAMLRAWSGRTVGVWSGVAVASHTGTEVDVVLTMLRMASLSEHDVAAYVATGEPRGVAGAFRVQGRGAALVTERHGCWTNVVGLPVCRTLALLLPHELHGTGDGCSPGRTPPVPEGWPGRSA